jgi:hypothetical protein
MSFRETTISIIDTLAWCGSGALVLFFVTLAIRALWLGRVPINGKIATKLDEPVGYLWSSLHILAVRSCSGSCSGVACALGWACHDGTRPNNSFKPNLLRYTKHMAEKACHVFGSATQVGLTQALGLTWKIEVIRWIRSVATAVGGSGSAR